MTHQVSRQFSTHHVEVFIRVLVIIHTTGDREVGGGRAIILLLVLNILKDMPMLNSVLREFLSCQGEGEREASGIVRASHTSYTHKLVTSSFLSEIFYQKLIVLYPLGG